MFAKLEKLGAREKLGLIVATLFILTLAIDRLVVRSVVKQLEDLDSQVAVEEKSLYHNMQVLQTEQKVRDDYEILKQSLDSAGETSAQIEKMKAEVEDLASASGLLIRDLEHRDPRKFPAYEEYVVELREFEGTMPTVLSFLNSLHDTPGMMRATKLVLSPLKEGGYIKGSVTITKVAHAGGA